ncbi:MAG: hypothetical protein IIC86_08160 [Chloroflexi bacterium]|nr:hypothetical protein [Chloroflexota bacterium]
MLAYDKKTALLHVRKADPTLAGVIEVAGPFEIEQRGGAFKSLARAVFFQQLAGAAARAIMGRVLATLETDEERWYEPARFLQATDEELRAAGLSRQKTMYLRDLSEKFGSGELSEDEFGDLDDEAVIERVTLVKGIGRWTAEMFLILCQCEAALDTMRGCLSARVFGRVTYPWRHYRRARWHHPVC